MAAWVSIANSQDLGGTQLRIHGNQDCTSIAGETVQRCFDLAPANTTGRDATITFFFAGSELAGNTCDELNAYGWGGSNWQNLALDASYGSSGRSCASEPYSLRLVGVSDFSPFVLKSGEPPDGYPVTVAVSSFTAAVTGDAEVLLACPTGTGWKL